MHIEDVEPAPLQQNPQIRSSTAQPATTGPACLAEIETLEDIGLVRPEPEMDDRPGPAESSAGEADSPASRRSGIWLFWLLALGVVGLAVVGTLNWVVNLVASFPLLGLPAALAAGALLVGLLGLILREVGALRRLHDVEQVRIAWAGADGEPLRQLILRVGAELGDVAAARRAADLIDDAGPAAARRKLSREVVEARDRRAAKAVASAARQSFVLVAASPSPALDALLLIARAARLLRQISVIYGYRPGTLALRSLAIAATRDAAALVIADALTQTLAQSAAHAATETGDSIASQAPGPVGAILGLGLSIAGRTFGATGSAVGGGAAAAWRLYRFGLVVLVASRPVPLDDHELKELRDGIRAEVTRIGRGHDADK